MRQWYGYSAKLPAPVRAASPLCVSPAGFETGEGYIEVYCNARLNHEGPHYSVGLVGAKRYLLAEWGRK